MQYRQFFLKNFRKNRKFTALSMCECFLLTDFLEFKMNGNQTIDTFLNGNDD